jgi:hypothetical protein
MRRSPVTCAVVALVLAAPAAAELPRAGALVPGRSLGGIRIGQSEQAVRAALGGFYGTCRACRLRTWYFTYRPFTRPGLGVEFTRGRVSGVYTLWHPSGWHARHKLGFGTLPLVVHKLVGRTTTVVCAGYEVLVRDSRHARDAYYLYGGRLWGFGLFQRGADPCR